jgi:hypothetical protein
MTNFIRRLCAFLTLFVVLFPIQYVHADDYDYVNEVLEEDERHYGEEHFDEDDTSDFYEKQRLQQEETERQRQAEEERLAREQADTAASERERQFQAELARMNAEQQKAAMRQKKKDERVVRSVLKAAKKNKLYAILGMKNWNLRIPSREIKIANFNFTIPGIALKQTSTKDIRKAYRNRAMLVHPDKNRDGRAVEAFIAVENAASILADERLRVEYDEEARLSRLERRKESKNLVFKTVSTVQGVVGKVLRAIHAVLGPFATPVLIILALLI